MNNLIINFHFLIHYKGMKGKEFKDYWDLELGVSYIPYDKINKDTDFELLEDGGMIDDESMSPALFELRNKKLNEDKEQKLNEMSSSQIETSLTSTVTTSTSNSVSMANVIQPPIPPSTSKNQPQLLPSLPIVSLPNPFNPLNLPPGIPGVTLPPLNMHPPLPLPLIRPHHLPPPMHLPPPPLPNKATEDKKQPDNLNSINNQNKTPTKPTQPPHMFQGPPILPPNNQNNSPWIAGVPPTLQPPTLQPPFLNEDNRQFFQPNEDLNLNNLNNLNNMNNMNNLNPPPPFNQPPIFEPNLLMNPQLNPQMMLPFSDDSNMQYNDPRDKYNNRDNWRGRKDMRNNNRNNRFNNNLNNSYQNNNDDHRNKRKRMDNNYNNNNKGFNKNSNNNKKKFNKNRQQNNHQNRKSNDDKDQSDEWNESTEQEASNDASNDLSNENQELSNLNKFDDSNKYNQVDESVGEDNFESNSNHDFVDESNSGNLNQEEMVET